MAKLIICKHCGNEIANHAKVCPNCGGKNKKPFYKSALFWIIIFCVLCAAAGSGKDDNEVKKVGTVGDDTTVQSQSGTQSQYTSQVKESNGSVSSQQTGSNKTTDEQIQYKDKYEVGDILEDGNLHLVYVASGDYIEDNQFIQPDAGKKYVFFEFYFENIGDTSNELITSYSFKAYADGYAVDSHYSSEDSLSATISPGRSTTGKLIYEVPENATEIELEYETNFITEDKIKFIYADNVDSGFVPEKKVNASANAFKVGDIVETSNLKISYVSCEEDNSYSYVSPAQGNCYMTCVFEFENVSSKDETVSFMEFNCYADGASCDYGYSRDDLLSATISSGRKASGSVTFEVPVDAEVIELEYTTNYWTSDKIIFTVK